MRVLHVLYQSLPQVVGSTIRSRDLMWAQQASGIELRAISSPFQPGAVVSVGDEIIEGVQYRRTFCGDSDLVPSDREKGLAVRLRRLWMLRAFESAIESLVEEFRPDVVHAHAMFVCALASWRPSRKRNIPMVYEVRSMWEENPLLRRRVSTKLTLPIVRILESLACRSADGVVAINEGLASALVARGVPTSKIHIVGNAVRTELFSDYVRPNWKTRQGPLRFGYVGSITALEGVDLLIEAFRASSLDDSVATLDIFGGGPELKRVKELARSRGAATITVHGPVSPEGAREALRHLDVAVMARRRNAVSESVTPLKPLEAMAAGSLVLASDVGGMRELIEHESNGILFAPDSVDELASAFRRVCLELGPEAANSMTANAREYVERERSWIANGERYERYYRSLLRAHSHSPD